MSTIKIPTGTRGQLNATSGNLYQGNGPDSSIIENTSSAAYAHSCIFNSQHDITFQGIGFRGNGTKGDSIKNITFRDCRISDCNNPAQKDHQGFNTAGAENVLFERVEFRNCAYAWILNNLIKGARFVDCVLKDCGLGGKAALDNESIIDVIRLKVDGQKFGYYGIEYQPKDKSAAGSDKIRISVQDFAYVNAKGSGGSNTGAISLPVEFGYAEILRAYVDGRSVGGKGLAMVFELGANGGKIEDCWAIHGNDPVSVNHVSQNCKVQNNRFVDFKESANMEGGAAPGSNTFTNNGDETPLPVDGGWSLVGVNSGVTPVPNPITILEPPPEKTYKPGESGVVRLSAVVPGIAVDIRGDNANPIVTVKNTDRASFTVPANATADQKVVFQFNGVEAVHDIVVVPVPPVDDCAAVRAENVRLREQVSELTGQVNAANATIIAQKGKIDAAIASQTNLVIPAAQHVVDLLK